MATVLVVDDEREIRTMLELILSAAGHEVMSAGTGKEAIDIVESEAVDAVVLDIMMPEMNGYEVLMRIRGMRGREDTPVIVVTARHDPAGLAREVAAGATDHIAKPFLPSELEGAIARATDGAAEAASSLRRRILGTDADVYSAVGDLVATARAAQN